MKLTGPLPALLALVLAGAADAKGGKDGKSSKMKKMKPCKQQFVEVWETFDDLTMIFPNRPDACDIREPECNELVDGTPKFILQGGYPRRAGDYDVWNDRVWTLDKSFASNQLPDGREADIKGLLTEVRGNHRGHCMWTSDSGASGLFDGASICAGTLEINDEVGMGRSSIEIAGSAPKGVTDWTDEDDVVFSVTGGTGDFMGGYGFVDPAVYQTLSADGPFAGCLLPNDQGDVDLVNCIQFLVEIKCPKWDFDD